MKKMFTVNHGTYPFDVLVAIGQEHEDIVRWFKRKKIKLSEEETEKLWMSGKGRTVMLKSGATVLRVDDIKNKADFHAHLSHEIFHAVEFLFDKIGLEHNVDAGEAFAYQIQYLTGSIYEKLNKR